MPRKTAFAAEWAGPTAICFEPGRLFDISGRVSKVGVGTPTNWGLENSICSGLVDDTIGSSKLNYNVTASVRQPRFVSPIIAGTFALFAERRSEFEVYRREEIGLSATLLREDYHRVPITVGYKLSYGRTTASAASFCAFFNACTPQDAQRLAERRVLGIFGAGIAWPRSNNPLDPTRGHVYSIESAVSSPLTGSDDFGGIPPVHRRRLLVQTGRSSGVQLAPPGRNHVCPVGGA